MTGPRAAANRLGGTRRARALCDALEGKAGNPEPVRRLIAEARRQIAAGTVCAETLSELRAALAARPATAEAGRSRRQRFASASERYALGLAVPLFTWTVPPSAVAVAVLSPHWRPLTVAIALAAAGLALLQLKRSVVDR